MVRAAGVERFKTAKDFVHQRKTYCEERKRERFDDKQLGKFPRPILDLVYHHGEVTVVCVRMCAYARVCARVYVSMCVRRSVCVCVYQCVCVSVCVIVCVYQCPCVRVCVSVCVDAACDGEKRRRREGMKG